MKIVNHRLQGVRYQQTPNISSYRINPKLVVEHYTAGFSFSGAVNWLTNRTAKASAQVVIGNEPGEIVQLAEFTQRAWHAGPSKYGKYSGLNSHSVGLEITNVGWLKKLSDGRYQDWAGNTYREGEGHLKGRDLLAQPHSRVGGGMLYWPSYLPWQLEIAEEVTEVIVDTYDIEDIVSHEEIDTRGWKTDPGPQFPMQDFKRLLGNDRDDEQPQVDDQEARLVRAMTEIDEIAEEALSTGYSPDLPLSVAEKRWALAGIRKSLKDYL
jgi:N-acetylmuramoyl-L-alanine amidase